MALFDVIGELDDPNADVKPRFLVNQGGTSSGKTYTIMQRLIVLSFEHPMAIITVCGQDLPNLKVGSHARPRHHPALKGRVAGLV